MNASASETLPTISISLRFSLLHSSASPFPPVFFFFFFFFFFLIYYPELCDCFLSNSGNALCSGPCFSHSLLLGWFILAVALTLVHSFSLSCNIPQCDYFSVISPSSSIWVISSFVVMNYSFMIFHLCESCRL